MTFEIYSLSTNCRGQIIAIVYLPKSDPKKLYSYYIIHKYFLKGLNIISIGVTLLQNYRHSIYFV